MLRNVQAHALTFDWQMLNLYNFIYVHACSLIVSVRHIEPENLDWRLFRISDQRLIKWFEKSCPRFELGFHLNLAMPISLPGASVVYIQYRNNSPLSWKLHFLHFKYCKSHKYAMSDGHFHCLQKLPRCIFGGFTLLQR